MNHIIKKVAVITVLVFIFALAGPVVADLALDNDGDTVIAAVYRSGPDPDRDRRSGVDPTPEHRSGPDPDRERRSGQ